MVQKAACHGKGHNAPEHDFKPTIHKTVPLVVHII